MRTASTPADSVPEVTLGPLRLRDASDREAFRRWFTFLAEYQSAIPPRELPGEIKDCSALLRFAYREALWKHDPAWVSAMRLEGTPMLPGVKAYQLPHTPLGARVFRVRAGAHSEPSTFAEFADAKTLKNLNTHVIGRDIVLARPGDLIFFRQWEQSSLDSSSYHSMIFLGVSQLPGRLGSTGNWVVYHTGPIGRERGEIRRVRLTELMHHPDARWRPETGNPNFLGIYRWNILRDDQ